MVKNLKELVAELSSKNPRVRWEAAEQLGLMGDTRAVPYLIKVLTDDDWHVRRRAADALGIIPNKKSVPFLVKLLDDEHFFVRKSAVTVLGKLRQPNTYKHIVKKLVDWDENVRLSAIDAIGNLGEAQGIEPLLPLLETDDADTRVHSSYALSKLAQVTGSLRIVKPMLQHLHDANTEVSSNAYQALVYLTIQSMRRNFPYAAQVFIERMTQDNEQIVLDSGNIIRDIIKNLVDAEEYATLSTLVNLFAELEGMKRQNVRNAINMYWSDPLFDRILEVLGTDPLDELDSELEVKQPVILSPPDNATQDTGLPTRLKMGKKGKVGEKQMAVSSNSPYSVPESAEPIKTEPETVRICIALSGIKFTDPLYIAMTDALESFDTNLDIVTPEDITEDGLDLLVEKAKLATVGIVFIDVLNPMGYLALGVFSGLGLDYMTIVKKGRKLALSIPYMPITEFDQIHADQFSDDLRNWFKSHVPALADAE